MAGEAFDVYYRDVLDCIKDLFGKPEFASSMKFAPERHYADEDQTLRIYCDIHTGKWWWATQVGFQLISERLQVSRRRCRLSLKKSTLVQRLSH